MVSGIASGSIVWRGRSSSSSSRFSFFKLAAESKNQFEMRRRLWESVLTSLSGLRISQNLTSDLGLLLGTIGDFECSLNVNIDRGIHLGNRFVKLGLDGGQGSLKLAQASFFGFVVGKFVLLLEASKVVVGFDKLEV